MKALKFKEIPQEDMADAPAGAWKDKLIFRLNITLQQLYNGLINGLTTEENSLAQVKSFLLTGGASTVNNTFSFSTTQSRFPSGLYLRRIAPVIGTQVFDPAPFVSWTWVNGQLKIIGITGLTTGVQYTVTVEIMWSPIPTNTVA